MRGVNDGDKRNIKKSVIKGIWFVFKKLSSKVYRGVWFNLWGSAGSQSGVLLILGVWPPGGIVSLLGQ